MKRNRNVLMIVAVIFIAVGSVRAAATKDLEATLKRMEQRLIVQDEKIAAQNKKIAKLSGADTESAKARENEIRAIIEDMNLSQSTLPKWMKNLTFYGDLRLRYQLTNYSEIGRAHV